MLVCVLKGRMNHTEFARDTVVVRNVLETMVAGSVELAYQLYSRAVDPEFKYSFAFWFYSFVNDFKAWDWLVEKINHVIWAKRALYDIRR